MTNDPHTEWKKRKKLVLKKEAIARLTADDRIGCTANAPQSCTPENSCTGAPPPPPQRQ